MPGLTDLLNDWASGDATALDRLLPLVYPELQALARAYLRRQASPVTLQTTAVVNELFVKLLAKPPKRLDSRRHFYVLAARVIRMALVDHYRQSRAEKRAGSQHRVRCTTTWRGSTPTAPRCSRSTTRCPSSSSSTASRRTCSACASCSAAPPRKPRSSLACRRPPSIVACAWRARGSSSASVIQTRRRDRTPMQMTT